MLFVSDGIGAAYALSLLSAQVNEISLLIPLLAEGRHDEWNAIPIHLMKRV
jgi:hypothetical protein